MLSEKNIFISKHVSEVSKFAAFIESKGGTLISHSFLNFSPVEFSIDFSFDVIFFNSKRSIEYFLNQESVLPNISIACAGRQTAAFAERNGLKVEFIGESSGDMDAVGSKFKEWLGDRKVLFPVSTISLNTVSNLIPNNQKEVVEVYDTNISADIIPACSTYIFTSPSNVIGFFQSNTIPNNARVIAWGKSSQQELLKKRIKNPEVLKDSSMEELVNLI